MIPVSVKALDGYKIEVTFGDGTNGIVDLKEFIQKGIFTSLKDKSFFSKVYINSSAIAWSDELEIDSHAIYAEILHKEPLDLFHTSIAHAAD